MKEEECMFRGGLCLLFLLNRIYLIQCENKFEG